MCPQKNGISTTPQSTFSFYFFVTLAYCAMICKRHNEHADYRVIGLLPHYLPRKGRTISRWDNSRRFPWRHCPIHDHCIIKSKMKIIWNGTRPHPPNESFHGNYLTEFITWEIIIPNLCTMAQHENFYGSIKKYLICDICINNIKKFMYNIISQIETMIFYFKLTKLYLHRDKFII